MPYIYPMGGKGGGSASPEQITAAVDAYLAENFTNPSSPPLDRTLASSSSAAPADIVGDIKSAVDDMAVTINSIIGNNTTIETVIQGGGAQDDPNAIIYSGGSA